MANIHRLVILLMLVPCWLLCAPDATAQGDDAISEELRGLIANLESPDAGVRTQAAMALNLRGERAKAAIPALTRALKDEEKAVRRWAALALGKMTPESKSALAELGRVAEADADEQVRRNARSAMEKIRAATGAGATGEGGDPEVLRSMAALGSDQPLVRMKAAMDLGQMGPRAKDALAALTRVSEGDPDSYVRQAALEAVGKIRVTGGGGDPRLEALIANLKSADALVRMKAAMDLGQMGAQAKAAVPALTEASRSDTDPYARQAAADALAKIEKAAAGTGGTTTERPDPEAARLVGTWRGVISKANLAFVEVITFHPGDKVEAKLSNLNGLIFWEGKGKYVYAKGMLRTDFGDSLPQEQPVTWLTDDSYEVTGQGVTVTFERIR